MDSAGGVLKQDTGKYGCIGLVWQMRTKTDAGIERPIQVKSHGRPELVHRFACQTDKKREGVAALFDADAPGMGGDKVVGRRAAGQIAAAADAIFHVLDADILFWTSCQLDHSGPMQGDKDFLGVVIEILPDDENGLPITVTIRVRERDVRGERDITGHLLPEITELIAHVPDIVAGGVDGVLTCTGIVTGAARQQRAANVRLALKQADRGVEIFAGAVKVGRWRDLDMVGGTRLRPHRHGGGGVGCLRLEQIQCAAPCQGK